MDSKSEAKNRAEVNPKLNWHCISKHDKCTAECKLQTMLSLLGKNPTLEILRLLLVNHKLRFTEIGNNLHCSSKTLTSRLRELETVGIIERSVFNEIPIRVEYSLTKAGRNLEPLFESLTLWVKNWC